MLYEKTRGRYPGVMEKLMPPDRVFSSHNDAICAERI